MAVEAGLPLDPANGRYRVLGVPVWPVDLDEASALVERWVESRTKVFLCHANVHGVMVAQHDTELREAYEAGVTMADGMPLVWLGRRAGLPGVGRVYGPDLMLRTAELCSRKALSAFFYGGAPGVADEVARRFRARFPGMRVAGVRSPPFRALSEVEREEDIARINDARPDVVWIALGCPRQEKWVHRNRLRLEAPILAAVGAAFDFHSGRIRQAPAWVQRAGLEWAFRLSQEPVRLSRRYIVGNTKFLAALALQAVARKGRKLSGRASR